MDRKEIMKKVSRVVIKVGTNVLTEPDHRLDISMMEHLGEQLCWLMEKKKKVVLVTSGAIGAGMHILGWKRRPRQIEKLQAAASVGQSRLMRFYERIFREEGRNVGQMLLTRDICDSPIRMASARLTLETLLRYGILPIINENDAIADEEISGKFSDNDSLSVLVVKLLNADMLLLLSNVDGFYCTDPRKDRSARLLCEVRTITPELKKTVCKAGPSEGGTGGMSTKLSAIEEVLEMGKPCVLANGKRPWVIREIFNGKKIGTLFSLDKAEKKNLPKKVSCRK